LSDIQRGRSKWRRENYFFLEEDLFLDEDFFREEDFFRGTLAPLRRASERPMAIACFRLFTLLPDLPLLSFPRFRSCIALSTFSDAFLPYLAMLPPGKSACTVIASRASRRRKFDGNIVMRPMFHNGQAERLGLKPDFQSPILEFQTCNAD
jgi:hypothetical protein